MSNTPSETTQEMLAELRKAAGTMRDLAARADELMSKLEGKPQPQPKATMHPREKERRLKAGVLVWMLRRYDVLELPNFDVEGPEAAEELVFQESRIMGLAELAVEAMDILDEPRREYTDNDYLPTEG